MNPLPATPSPARSRQRQGLLLGLLGVGLFALTLPMTRLATGSADAPQLPGLFIAMGRAVLAAVLSMAYLAWVRAPWPRAGQWRSLVLTAAGVVMGFPLLTSLAMRDVEAVHASVIVGVLPLTTAAVGAWLHRQRPSPGFWLCAAVGTALVVAFALMHSGAGGLHLKGADGLLLAAMVCAALGYGHGARLSQDMPAPQVICWALVISLPLTLPLGLASAPALAQWPHIQPRAWWALGYVSVFSAWLGFFAWYRGLALGGTVRVSQVQLVQPFLGMLFAVPLLGESLDALTLGFGLAVMAVVLLGRKMPVRAAAM